MNDNELRLGIALCGAELAGTLHVGVLFALERLGIRPTHIAGTSAGALVASMYAHGYRFDDFRRAVKKFPGLLLLEYGFPMVSSMSNLVRHAWKGKDVSAPNGVFRGKRLQRYVKRIHHNRLPKLPYYVVATCTRQTLSHSRMILTAFKRDMRNKALTLSRRFAVAVRFQVCSHL
jgi:NTE family protein